jgi:hypothetical protein
MFLLAALGVCLMALVHCAIPLAALLCEHVEAEWRTDFAALLRDHLSNYLSLYPVDDDWNEVEYDADFSVLDAVAHILLFFLCLWHLFFTFLVCC